MHQRDNRQTPCGGLRDATEEGKLAYPYCNKNFHRSLLHSFSNVCRPGEMAESVECLLYRTEQMRKRPGTNL